MHHYGSKAYKKDNYTENDMHRANAAIVLKLCKRRLCLVLVMTGLPLLLGHFAVLHSFEKCNQTNSSYDFSYDWTASPIGSF